MYPADVVLFEGILAFYSQEVRDLFHMKLFVDTDADTRLSRRGACARPPGPAGGLSQAPPSRGLKPLLSLRWPCGCHGPAQRMSRCPSVW